MENKFLIKIKVFLLKHLISSISVFIAILALGFSFYYIYSNECPECEDCSLMTTNNEIEDIALIKEKNYVKVDVKGAVKNSKVYELEEGATVEDAIFLAGGIKSTGTTSNINLSKKVKDEMVIYVFTKDELKKEEISNSVVCEVPRCECETIVVNECISTETTNNSSSENNTATSSTGKVSINTATLEELMTLDGIGESKAKNIIEYRNKNGNFEKIEDIKNVSGIGDSAYEKIKDKIEI